MEDLEPKLDKVEASTPPSNMDQWVGPSVPRAKSAAEVAKRRLIQVETLKLEASKLEEEVHHRRLVPRYTQTRTQTLIGGKRAANTGAHYGQGSP